MATTLVIQPHSDDAVLFACYQLMYEPTKTTIVTVLRSAKQEKWGISDRERQQEDFGAAMCLGVGVKALEEAGLGGVCGNDEEPDWGGVRGCLASLAELLITPVKVLAPAWEVDGHEDHNRVAELVAEFWPDYTAYMTYRRGHGRSEGALEVRPSAGWRARKMRAMSYYESQIDLENTRPWFNNWDREWLA